MVKIFILATLLSNYISSSIVNNTEDLFSKELKDNINYYIETSKNRLDINTVYKLSDEQKKYVLHAGGELMR